MKKKLLLSALFAALCALIVTGCGSSSDDPAPVTPVNLDTPDTLVGTYEVDYFITTAAGIGITNDCTKALANLDPSAACDPANNVNKAGKAVIVKNQDGTYSVTSKMQIWGGIFDTIPESLASFVTPNMYNYTAYNAVNADSINTQDKTINSGANAVVGVSGRNMVALTSDNTAPFSFKVNDDGTITSTVALSQPVPSSTKVVLRKVSDAAGALDPNTLIDTNAPGFGGFVSDLLSRFNGVYKMDFFGTSQTDGKCEGGNCVSSGGDMIAAMAGLLYVTNDCQYAIDNPDVIGVTVNNADFTNQCDVSADALVDAGNQIAIEFKNGKAYVTTKTQLTSALMQAMAQADQYQYQQYDPADTLTANGAGNLVLGGTGLSGNNYNIATTPPSISEPVAYSGAVLKAELSADGNTIILKTDLPGKVIMNMDGALVTVTAHVTMIGTRTSSDYVAPVNEITADFLLNPNPAP